MEFRRKDAGMGRSLARIAVLAGLLFMPCHCGKAPEPADVSRTGLRPEPAEKPTPPVVAAAEAGRLDVVRTCIEKGADVNAKDKSGWTALHHAASKGHKEIVEILIAKGASVDARDNYESTPLTWAANYGHKDLVLLLIEKGADPNARNLGKRTPLDTATEAGHSEVAELIRQHGGNSAKDIK